MSYLGKFYVVELPEHVTDLYNRDNPAISPIPVGTRRPVLVVGEQVGQTQEVDSGTNNPDGTHIMKTVSLPDTVNVVVFHDGAVAPHYVQGVPIEALVGLDSTPPVEPVTGSTENPATPKSGGSWS